MAAQMFTLRKESELRIELAVGDGLRGEVATVTLVSGSAEVFGVPIAEVS